MAPPPRRQAGGPVTVSIGGQSLVLSNLDKVLYPQTGFTKGDVITYYADVSEVLLPGLRNRILTRKRWPDGTAGPSFFEKNTPRGTPDFVRTAFMAEHGDDGVEYVVCDELATLVWLANLAALELHTPQWRLGQADEPLGADQLVFDLDPGAPATVVECCDVAQAVRTVIGRDGLTGYPKTSGNKGAQLVVPIEPTPPERVSGYAKRVAQELEAALPDLVVSSMDKKLRPGKVFIDWSQNNGAKTTIVAYSLRGIGRPTVSTPLLWDEVEGVSRAEDLVFTADQIRGRLDSIGDPLAPMDAQRAALPAKR